MFENPNFLKFCPLPPLKIKNSKIAESDFSVFKSSRPMCNFVPPPKKNLAFPPLPPHKIENSKIAENNF